MKKSVGIITFHASHNYGSMLQAYALQRTVEQTGLQCEIINFRTERQRKAFLPSYMRGNVYERLKRFFIQMPYVVQVWKKYQLFEQFMNSDLHLSAQEYTTLEELNQFLPTYDYYISGSDQIWNPQCFDFDIAYYLPFVKNGKCIAYAPSMGPYPEQNILDNIQEIASLLNRYSAIGVREPRTAHYLESIYHHPVEVVADPTLLLTCEQWNTLIAPQPIIEGDYIFLYSPKFDSFEDTYQLAENISNRYGIKVVLSRGHTYLCDAKRWRKFKVKADIGPREFLNLCQYARLVCCDSFHAVVFSILFHRPFVVMQGMEDSRISNLLEMTKLQNRSFDFHTSSIGDWIFQTDYKNVEKLLQPYIEKSLAFLTKSLC